MTVREHCGQTGTSVPRPNQRMKLPTCVAVMPPHASVKRMSLPIALQVRSVIGSLAMIAFLPLATVTPDVAAAVNTASGAGTAITAPVAEDPPSEALPSLAEILNKAEAHDAAVLGIRSRLQDDARIDALAAKVGGIQKAFTEARDAAGSLATDKAGLYGLADLRLVIRRNNEEIGIAVDALTAKAKALDADLDQLASSENAWQELLEAARVRQAPPDLLAKFQTIAPSAAALALDVRTHRDQILGALGQATGLRDEMNAMANQLDTQGEQMMSRMQSARDVPIWKVTPKPDEFGRVRAVASTGAERGLRYLSTHALELLLIIALAFGLSYSLIVVSRGRIARDAETDPHARRTVALFRHPGVAAWVVTLLALIQHAPPAPLIFYDLMWSLLPIPAAILARKILGSSINLSLYTLAVAVMSVSLLGALDLLPLTSRMLVIAQCLALGAALVLDLRRGGLEKAFPFLAPATLRLIVGAALALLALSIVANVFGYLGVSRTLRNGILGTLGFAMVLAVIRYLAYGLILALMQTRTARRLRIVRFQSYKVQQAASTLLTFTAALAWIVGVMFAFGFGIEALKMTQSFSKAKLQLGSATLSMESIVAGLLVLGATYALVKVVRLALEEEILPRLNLKAGVPFAVSTLTRYVLVTVGVVLAMVAMGIDLTKASLLTGALGVGIGFGLQSIVNNFVSGLILLVERPISVGDTVQTQETWGEVKRIGVRSSTVRTFQGAEVIIPNADLISKDVTNWTLSDSRRRLEIDVGVAYGSDPERIVRLLEAAAQEVKEVLGNPPARAWFSGFGDSSLNFRLYAWIDNYDRGIAAQSALRVEILKKLTQNGIEIPFPQRDINIRSAPGWPAPPVDVQPG